MMWGNSNTSTNALSWELLAGSNVNGAAAFVNVTPAGFTGQDGQGVGLFPINVAETQALRNGMAPGWNIVRQGVGPVTGVSVNAAGGNYGNGAIAWISNGVANAFFQITANATGNVTAITLGRLAAPYGTFTPASYSGSGFLNATAVGLAGGANSLFQANISAPGTAYGNGDLVVFSNGVVNAIASITTNSTGAITNLTFSQTGAGFDETAGDVVVNIHSSASLNTISSANIVAGGTSFTNGNIVTFSNGVTNATATVTTNATGGITSLAFTAIGSGFTGNAAQVVVTIANSTGGSTGVGSGSNIVANSFGPVHGSIVANSSSFDTGSGLTVVVTLGGRAGRVTYEPVAYVQGMSGNSAVPRPANPSYSML